MRLVYHNPTDDQIIAKFEDSYIPEPNSGCWLWLGPFFMRGDYGCFSCGRRTMVRAHRLAYEIYCDAPGDEHVLHTCDMPSCVNPDHLFLGSQADNMRDKAMKGRQLEGEANPAYKHGLYVGDKKNPEYPTGIVSR